MFDLSPRVKRLKTRLDEFISDRVLPLEQTFYEQAAGPDRWVAVPVLEQLRQEAKAAGLWNLFLADPNDGQPLSNVEYAPLSESMGRVAFGSHVFNCNAPDTGNIDILKRFGSNAQKEKWLYPLLEGEIRSCFGMTEPAVASSDATNIASEIRRDGDDYVINGTKWWTSGIGEPNCRLIIFMGRSGDDTAEKHKRHSMILVPIDTPGVKIERMLSVLGFDEAPHGHAVVSYDNVRVPAANMLLGENRGFEIAQARLGPGRIHHCMRMVGHAERALQAMCQRLQSRVAFGVPLSRQSLWQHRVADARIQIDQARLLTLKAAHTLDTLGVKGAKTEIAMIKVAAPNMACQVIDWAIQAHGGGGLDQASFGLAYLYARARAVRIVDGPDEVHRNAIGRAEIGSHPVMQP